MSFGLIIIGDEILSGRRKDGHMAKVIELLNARGHALAWVRYLGDERAQITAALKEALVSGDIVFSCGGIGATPDDHTRQCAAAASGRPLALHPEARLLIEQRMRDVAAEQGVAFEPDRPDNIHRLNMGVFPEGASLIPNPYNRIPGFSLGDVHFVPGFPVMAHPMIEWLLDERYGHLKPVAHVERAVYVQGSMEATLTPLMEAIEAEYPGVRIFSLPSVDHPLRGRHIELGVKGAPEAVEPAFAALQAGLAALPGVVFGTE
ncbi:MAG: molybdopterin-binding protein [Burkholderiaceae bacterium]